MYKNTTIKIPPHSLEIEKLFLSALIANTDNIIISQEKVSKNDFYKEINGKIFDALCDLKHKQSDILPLTVAEEVGNYAYISEIFAFSIDTNNFRAYMEKLLEYSKKRKIESLGAELYSGGMDNDEAIKTALDVILELTRDTTEDTSIKGIIKELEELQKKNIEHLASGKQYIGLETGIESLDKMTDGIQPSTLWLVNAYTSVGKTFFALNAIVSALKAEKRVCLIAMEMSKEQLAARVIGVMSGLNSLAITKGYHAGDEREEKAKATLYDMDFTVHKRKRYLHEIINTLYSEHAKKPVDLIVIDYLQHIKTKDKRTRYERFSDASNDIQDFVDRTGVPVMLLSQIDNFSARNKDTEVIATKGSGDVPADADVVILLQHDKERQQCYQDHIKAVKCIIQKQRNGMTGQLELIMNTKDGKFDDAKNYTN